MNLPASTEQNGEMAVTLAGLRPFWGDDSYDKSLASPDISYLVELANTDSDASPRNKHYHPKGAALAWLQQFHLRWWQQSLQPEPVDVNIRPRDIVSQLHATLQRTDLDPEEREACLVQAASCPSSTMINFLIRPGSDTLDYNSLVRLFSMNRFYYEDTLFNPRMNPYPQPAHNIWNAAQIQLQRNVWPELSRQRAQQLEIVEEHIALPSRDIATARILVRMLTRQLGRLVRGNLKPVTFN